MFVTKFHCDSTSYVQIYENNFSKPRDISWEINWEERSEEAQKCKVEIKVNSLLEPLWLCLRVEW